MELRTLERLGLAALLVATIAGFAVYPGFPNFDTTYALVWARELVHFHAPSFEAFRAPTEHPLAIAVSSVLVPLGEGAARAMVLVTLISFAAAVAGVYRLGKAAFTPLVGAAGALVFATRFDFPSLSFRGYIDIPYVALLVWAAALECERPRRGGVVWVLLIAAGLLRPEAWALAGAYFLWLALGWRLGGAEAPRPARRDLLRWAGLVALAPVIWAGVDLAVTGDALFSFHATSETVGELSRGKSLTELPAAMLQGFTELDKAPVIVAGAAGLLAGVWFFPRRIVMPAVVLLSGIATFLAVGIAGLAVIDRYLVVAAAGLCVFAGLAAGGFTMLRSGTALRRLWIALAGLGVVAVVAYTATHTLNATSFADELAFRTDAHDDLVRVLDSPDVRRARDSGCGPVSTPTHKLIPEVRWVLDVPEDAVVARSDPNQRSRAIAGIAIYPQGRETLDKQAFDADSSALTQVPPAGFRRLAESDHYTVFARCG